jgi:hypothetical protein
MRGVDFPVLGVDNMGNRRLMEPGNDYTFPGNYVTEFPIKNMGSKRFGQVGMQKKDIPKYVEDRYQVQNTTDNTYSVPFTPLPKPVPVRNVKAPANLTNSRYQPSTTDNTYLVPPTALPKPTPAQLLRDFEIAVETEATEKEQQRLQAEREAAAKTREAVVEFGDESAKFTFPDGKTKAWKDMDWREQAYVSGKNLGSWSAGNWTDYINPAAMIGSLAEGLGSAPYVARETDSIMPYITGIGSPLLTGALGGIGAKTTGQFVNNLANPLAGVNLKGVGEYLTTQTPFKNPFKQVPKPTSVSFSADDVGKNLDEIYKNRIFLTDESQGIKNIPWNTKTNKSIQDEFIDEQTAYMNSDAFVEKMKTYHPDVNIEEYKKAILHNLENKITSATSYSDASLDINVGGWYRTKENLPNGTFIMPGYKPSFASRVRLANEEIIKPAFQSADDAGKSFTKNLGSTVEHELGHQRTNANWLIPDYLTKEYLTENLTKEGNMLASQEANSPFSFFNYYSDPTEFDTRLLNMKKDLKRQGIIDYTKSNDFTEELLNKLDVSNSRPANIAEELKDLEIGFLKGDYTKEQYEKLKNFYERSKNITTTSSNFTVTKDTKELLKYWNTKFLAEEMKKLPAIAPLMGVGGAGALYQYMQQPTERTYQMGGTIGVPRVNGQVVSSQPQLLTSVRRTRGPLTKNNKGDVKTMPKKAVKNILKNIR